MFAGRLLPAAVALPTAAIGAGRAAGDRPSDEVLASFADATNNPVWQQGMQRGQWTTAPPIGEGSIYEQEARMLGKAIASRFEVIEFDPGQRIRSRTIESTFPIELIRSVEPAGHRTCRARARLTGDPTGCSSSPPR